VPHQDAPFLESAQNLAERFRVLPSLLAQRLPQVSPQL
jgi:hypothetical protein